VATARLSFTPCQNWTCDLPFISKILRIPDLFVGPKIGIGRRVSDNGHAVMPLQPVGIKDFLALEIPARGMLLSPVLPEKVWPCSMRREAWEKAGSVSRLAWLSRAVALS
jgi:hypothetical protein